MSSALNEYDYYLKIVLVRKKLFVSVFLLVMTIGVVVAYMLPKQYEAKTTVFLEQNVITDLVKGIAVTPSVDAKLKMLSVALLSLSREWPLNTLAAKPVSWYKPNHPGALR